MKLVSFRVQNYRSINDSGWVDLDSIACVVGKNEAGKTSLLKALWKFNPYHDEPYSLDREWPRGRRKERSKQATVCTCRFDFSDEEQSQLAELHDSCKGIKSVCIRKEYSGKTWYTFEPKHPPKSHELAWVVSILEEHLSEVPEEASEHFRNQYAPKLAGFIKEVRENEGSEYAVNHLPRFQKTLGSFVSPDGNVQPSDNQAVSKIQQRIASAIQVLKVDPPVRRAIDTAAEWLPTFIYMDDYRVFNGRAHLDQVKSRRDAKKSEEQDDTIIMIMEQAGLDLAEEVAKGNSDDREQRMLDMNDASQTLTEEIAARWSQKKYEVQFQVDGQHFITFVKDSGTSVLVPLEERSKGFQWFFSFDMMFMCETGGEFKNAVILLDEPGLHLHASAQRDLLERMYSYAENNQLVYTTHLPFMVDPKCLESIFVCEESEDGTAVHQNWQTADSDARFTLQAALGLSWSHSLFVGQYNLVVEGITDFWYLSAFSSLLADAEGVGIDAELVITPAGGASKVAYVGTILKGQELDVCVLLDSDTAGDNAFEQLVHNWILEEKHALKLGDTLNKKGEVAIEDLFPEDYYKTFVETAYFKELNGKKLTFGKTDKRSVVSKCEDALAKAGVKTFNKGRVAKLILGDLAGKSLSDFEEAFGDRIRVVVGALNSVCESFRSEI